MVFGEDVRFFGKGDYLYFSVGLFVKDGWRESVLGEGLEVIEI